MTDNEIKKALECCWHNNECIGNECPFFEPVNDCTQLMAMEALDLINRLEAEVTSYMSVAEKQQSISMERHFKIKRLKEECERQQAEIERLREYEDIRPTGCPNCNRGNFSNSKFCSHCGIQLQGKKKNIKAEAIKEFAERLKDNFPYKNACYTFEGIEYRIDNLVKEMEGDVK